MEKTLAPGKKPRAAQIWAVEIASSVNQSVLAGAALPFTLNLHGYAKGQAIRFAQEVNYAKRRQDELAKELYIQRVSTGGETYLKEPLIANWVLTFKMDGDEARFVIDFPKGRIRAQTAITQQFAGEMLAALDKLTPESAKMVEVTEKRPNMDSVIDKYLFGD